MTIEQLNNRTISTVFFGTHEFAATILEGLISNPLFLIELVVTQPDRPVGRDQRLESSPVKAIAQKYGLKIDQPENIKNYHLSLITYHLNIVAQYGLRIPKHILNAPQYGTMNVHTSLLPKYRGASPIQSALINGETKTGVTIMLMDEGLDTGPIILQKEIAIALDDTYETLDKKLALLGLDALIEAVPQYVEGKLRPTSQNDSKATTCKKLSREDGKIDWNKSAEEIYNLYRGLTPWPGVWTMLQGKRLKLLNIKPATKTIPPGQVMVENDRIYIGCGKDAIEVLELQLEGKKVMNAITFLNGYKDIEGATLSSS